MEKTSRGRQLLRTYGIFIILIALIVVLSILESSFLSIDNVKNILRQCSVYAILAFGMTFVMLAGGIDLSVGSVVALTSSVVGLLIVNAGLNMWLASLLAVAVGALCGFLNGFFIAKCRVPFFIATAGMMYMARGVAMVITKGNPISGLPDAFSIFGGMPQALIPPQVIIALIIFLACYVVLKHTKMGRHTYAVGSSKKCAKLSGINVDRNLITVFTISGLLAGVAGVIMASRLKIGSPIIAEGYEMDAIAGVAIGGTSMAGGSGSIVFSLVGALVLTVIRVGLNILGVSTNVQQIIIGALLVGVVAIDMLDKHKADA